MTINISSSVIKKTCVSIVFVALIAVLGLREYSLNNKVDYGAASINESSGSPTIQLSDSAPSDSTNTIDAVQAPSTTSTTGSLSQPAQAYQPAVNTKLTADSASKYENCWALFSQYDSAITSGNYNDASIYSDLSVYGVGDLSGGISPTEIEGVLTYSDSIAKAIGDVWTKAANALDSYHQAAVWLSVNPGVSSSANTQKGNQYLATARSQLAQAKDAYSSIPK